ncbi:protein of unknown function [Agreia sp. COWG]|nr:protein of unknown function [Agreia sp. COWG]
MDLVLAIWLVGGLVVTRLTVRWIRKDSWAGANRRSITQTRRGRAQKYVGRTNIFR